MNYQKPKNYLYRELPKKRGISRNGLQTWRVYWMGTLHSGNLISQRRRVAGEITDQVDSLSQTQLKLLKEQMERIIKNSKEDERKESKKWFERSVIPILRNFAETASAALEIADEDETVISATFQNKSGYDLTENDRHMRMLVGLSNHVSIEKNGDNIVLVLAFDCLDMK